MTRHVSFDLHPIVRGRDQESVIHLTWLLQQSLR
jgi:hypothetical protein